MSIIILGLKLQDKHRYSQKFQEILSKFDSDIKTRLGLNQTKQNNCNTYGIILLEIINKKSAQKLEKELLEIDNIEIQRIIFED